MNSKGLPLGIKKCRYQYGEAINIFSSAEGVI